MQTFNYLQYLVDEIHTTIMATIDSNNSPITCAIDMMDYDEQGLYFLTAKGKSFYTRLKENKTIALTGMKGESTLSSIAISIQGKVKELGNEKIEELFEKNPYMKEIYPDKGSRSILTVFYIYEGKGEYFNLTTKPITRASFTFGAKEQEIVHEKKYHITNLCTTCGLCVRKCPQHCITLNSTQASIQQEHCLHCGYCEQICPEKAIKVI